MLLVFLSSKAPAEQVVWQEPVSGDFSNPQRWFVNDGVPRRVPNAGDNIIIATTPPITVTIATSQTVAEAAVGETVTLDLNGTFIVTGKFSGAPIIMGKGTLMAGHWDVGAPSAVLSGARAEVGRLSLTGHGFGLMILGGGTLLAARYELPIFDGSRAPLIVDGADSKWTLQSDLKEVEAGGLEVTVRNGATAALAGVERAGYFLLDEGGQMTAGKFQPRHVAVRNGSTLTTGEAQPLGFGLGNGYGPAEVQGATWNVHGKLTVPGPVSPSLRIRDGGLIQAQDVDVIDSALVEIGTPDIGGTLRVANRLFKDRGTIDLNFGQLECGSMELRGEGAFQGSNGLTALGGTIDVGGQATIDTLAVMKGTYLSAESGVIGSSEQSSGGINADASHLRFRKSLVIGAEGSGGLISVDPFPLFTAPSIIIGAFATGSGHLELSYVTGLAGEWLFNGAMIIGDAGQGTMTLRDAGATFVSPGSVSIARQAGSRGTVNVLGPKASWTVLPFTDATLTVGERGQGTLSIEAGEVDARNVTIGRSGEDNTCLVSGPRPPGLGLTFNLDVLLHLIVGDQGRGTLSIFGKGSAKANFVTVGRQSSLANKITVAKDADLFGFRAITVGEDGKGTLEIQGAAYTDRQIVIAQGNQAEGVVILNGADANLQSGGGGLEMGGGQRAKATLTLLNGAEVKVNDLIAAVPANGQADISVTGEGSELSVANKMQLGRLGQTSGPVSCTFTGGSFGRIGKELLLRKNALVTLGGASVVVGEGNQPAPGNLLVRAGGRLTGDGRIKGRVFAETGGKVAPGAVLGTLTVDGDVGLLPGSVLELEISGPTAPTGHDFLHATGSIGMTGTVELKFINGYAPKAGDRYCFVKADGGLTIAPSNVLVSGLATGFAYDVTADDAGQFCLIARTAGAAASEPSVEIERITNNNLTVSWSAAEDWRLEASASLAGGWESVVPLSSGEGSFVLETTALGPSRFFRLRRQ